MMKLTGAVIIAAGATVSVGLCCLYLYKKANVSLRNAVVFNCSEPMDSRIQSYGLIEKGGFGPLYCFNKSPLRPRDMDLSCSDGTAIINAVLTSDWNSRIVLPPTIRVLSNLLSSTPVTDSRACILYPKASSVVFQRALRDTENVYAFNKPIINLVDDISSHQTFIYIRRGLFEKDNLIFLFICQVTIQVHSQANTMTSIEFKYFVRRLNKRHIMSSGKQYQLCIDTLPQACDTATWNEFKYHFGRIIFGINNDCDTLCWNYPGVYVNRNLLERDLLCTPNIQCIDGLPSSEGPILYSNTEIIPRTRTKKVSQTRLYMGHSECDMPVMSRTEKVLEALNGILATVPEPLKLMNIIIKIEKPSPHVIVSLKECLRMNGLVKEIRRSLTDLRLGLKGEKSITADMAELEECLFMDKLPPSWEKLYYPSFLPLAIWNGYIQRRFQELASRVTNFQTDVHVVEHCDGMQMPAVTRKPMKKFPANPSEYHPVLLLNQMLPGIRYQTVVVSNPPPVVEVKATINGTSFFGRGSTKKAAQVELCIFALWHFYGVPPSSFKKW